MRRVLKSQNILNVSLVEWGSPTENLWTQNLRLGKMKMTTFVLLLGFPIF